MDPSGSTASQSTGIHHSAEVRDGRGASILLPAALRLQESVSQQLWPHQPLASMLSSNIWSVSGLWVQ
jgi:hypothetical protein